MRGSWVVREVRKYKKDALKKGSTNKDDKRRDEGNIIKARAVRKGSIHPIFRGPHVREEGRNSMKMYSRETKFPSLTNVNRL